MFTIGELKLIRNLVAEHRPMASICRLFSLMYSRDQIVEAIDALRRNPSIHDAQSHVRIVLALQAESIPLINGKPLRKSYEPMFHA